MFTSEIFKIASDFLSDLAVNFVKKGLQKLTKPLIEEMLKEYLEKQPKPPSNTTIIIDNSINIREEVFALMQLDNRFLLENDYVTVEPITLQTSQTHLSDTELRAKLAALRETIQRRKLEQEKETPSKAINESLTTSTIEIFSPPDDFSVKTTTQNLPPAGPIPVAPKLQNVSESKVTVEVNAPDVQKLKLLQPIKPIEPLVTPPNVDDSQDKRPLSQSDYLKQKVSIMQSRIKVRKVERGEE